MDFIRDPYTIRARPFADRGDELEMVWRPASAGADVFPGPHKFYSLFHCPQAVYSPGGVGEVCEPSQWRRGLFPVNRWFNNSEALGYDVGLTPCVPLEWFRDGEVYDPDSRPLEVNEDGFPLCCLQRFVPRFGVRWGFRSVVNVVPLNDSCASAIDLNAGDVQTVTVPPGGERWYRVLLPAGTHYKVIFDIAPFVHFESGFAEPTGADCSSLTGLGEIFPAAAHSETPFIYPASPNHDWVKIMNHGAGNVVWTVTLQDHW